jgi:hypothetical protein
VTGTLQIRADPQRERQSKLDILGHTSSKRQTGSQSKEESLHHPRRSFPTGRAGPLLVDLGQGSGHIAVQGHGGDGLGHTAHRQANDNSDTRTASSTSPARQVSSPRVAT